MLSKYQLKISDLYKVPIGSAKKLVPNLFDKEKSLTWKNKWLNMKIYNFPWD